MKTKNQADHTLRALEVTSAANEDGISPPVSRDGANQSRSQPWSPYEVWRTRVKASEPRKPDAQI